MSAELLDTATVPAYLASRPDLAGLVDLSTLTVREVGDGNLNLVFIAQDAGGRGLVIKQSLPYVRMVGESWPLSQDRILAEARGYDAAVAHAPDLVPAYHGLDAPRRLIVVEDLSGWTVWRRALNEGRVSPGAGAAVGRYVARVAFGTSVFGRDVSALKPEVAAAINPEMCRITEDLIFTEPFVDHPHNAWDDELSPDVLALRDPALLADVAELKYRFVTAAQALVHGDLHTGSVFVPPEGAVGVSPAKVFDLEFSFYGPVGFDLGAVFGNYLIAQARAAVIGRPPEFRGWLAGLATETWGAFAAEIRALWPGVADPSYSVGFRERWLAQVWQDAVGFGGLKAIRRIVGLAKASDIETLERAERVVAARAVLTTARSWVEHRRAIGGPDGLPVPDVLPTSGGLLTPGVPPTPGAPVGAAAHASQGRP